MILTLKYDTDVSTGKDDIGVVLMVNDDIGVLTSKDELATVESPSR